MKFIRKFTPLRILLWVILTSVMAYASITVLSVVTLKQNNYPVVAGDLNVGPAGMDNVNGNSFVATGNEILVFLNTDTVTHTITITSVADPFGRFDTALTSYVV